MERMSRYIDGYYRLLDFLSRLIGRGNKSDAIHY